MVSIASLWIPILLSAVVVFIVSSVIHMMLRYHQTDYQAVPSEDQLMDAIRPFKIPPGDYHVPHAGSMDAMKSPEFQAKVVAGPVFWMTMLPNGPVAMGKSLAQWFAYSLLVSIVAAYVASRVLAPGADYLSVFRFVGVTAFAAYSLALMQNSIWYNRRWSTTLKSMFDGLVYAACTAGVFGWRWPS